MRFGVLRLQPRQPPRVEEDVTGSTTEEVYFYGAEGNRLLVVAPVVTTGSITFTVLKKYVYFGRHLVRADNRSGWKAIMQDRLASVVKDGTENLKYFPYGEEGTTTAQNRDKFATYYRDELTALDYAHHRYYASGQGRFANPDADGGSGSSSQSLNRHAYVGGGAANKNDPSGLFESVPDGCTLQNGTLTCLGVDYNFTWYCPASVSSCYDWVGMATDLGCFHVTFVKDPDPLINLANASVALDAWLTADCGGAP